MHPVVIMAHEKSEAINKAVQALQDAGLEVVVLNSEKSKLIDFLGALAGLDPSELKDDGGESALPTDETQPPADDTGADTPPTDETPDVTATEDTTSSDEDETETDEEGKKKKKKGPDVVKDEDEDLEETLIVNGTEYKVVLTETQYDVPYLSRLPDGVKTDADRVVLKVNESLTLLAFGQEPTYVIQISRNRLKAIKG